MFWNPTTVEKLQRREWKPIKKICPSFISLSLFSANRLQTAMITLCFEKHDAVQFRKECYVITDGQDLHLL